MLCYECSFFDKENRFCKKYGLPVSPSQKCMEVKK